MTLRQIYIVHSSFLKLLVEGGLAGSISGAQDAISGSVSSSPMLGIELKKKKKGKATNIFF